MVSFNFLVLATVATSALQVSATRFCQCENPSYDRVFPGIQQICHDLSNNWCSTNCNFFEANCDYCQYKPAGSGNDADYAKLMGWCRSQTGYDSNKQVSYSGTDVFCYSYQNRVPMKFGYTGCAHENNGDFGPPDKNDPGKAPNARVDFRYPNGGSYVTLSCLSIYPEAAQKIAIHYSENHNQCTFPKNETNYVIVECAYQAGWGKRAKMREDFRNDCSSIGGGENRDQSITIAELEAAEENQLRYGKVRASPDDANLQTAMFADENLNGNNHHHAVDVWEIDVDEMEAETMFSASRAAKHSKTMTVVYEDDGTKVIIVD